MKKAIVILSLLGLVVGATVFAESPKVTIRFDTGDVATGDVQMEVISSEGQRILIDAFAPGQLVSPVTKNDILLTTHTRSDEFAIKFPGDKLQARVGEIKRPGLYIRGVASSHQTDNLYLEEGGSNYIYLIEMAGMRIAHFGYIGQNQLTPEQLKAIGNVDIAITPIYNFNNQVDVYTLKAFNIMGQVKPKIVIPFSVDKNTVEYAARIWQSLYCDEGAMTITADKLPQKTQVVYLGPYYKTYVKIAKAKKAEY